METTNNWLDLEWMENEINFNYLDMKRLKMEQI